MQKETYSRPNNRTECSPCLRRRLHLVHLFFQGLFDIILHKCKRLQQADFKSVTTGRTKTQQTTKEHYATMQKETYSRPNNRTECSPCLRRRLHLVHLFFQGHFEIVLHKCNRLRQADFKSVTTGRKNTTNNKRTLCHYAKGNLFKTQQQN